MHINWSISITCQERWWNWMGRIVGLSSPSVQGKVVAKCYDEQCRTRTVKNMIISTSNSLHYHHFYITWSYTTLPKQNHLGHTQAGLVIRVAGEFLLSVSNNIVNNVLFDIKMIYCEWSGCSSYKSGEPPVCISCDKVLMITLFPLRVTLVLAR